MRPAPVLCALTLTALVALTGCGGAPSGAAESLDQVPVPEWFTKPADRTDGDHVVRTYLNLPKGGAQVELGYAQALDRAGWRYGKAEPRCRSAAQAAGADGCWTAGELALAYRAGGNDSGEDSRGPSTLTVVIAAAA